VTTFRFLTFMTCAACIYAQTPVDKAWTILSDAARDKSFERRGKAIHSLGLISGNARARTLAETALQLGFLTRMPLKQAGDVAGQGSEKARK